MLPTKPNVLISVIAVMATLLTSGCVSQRAVQSAITKSAVLPAPVAVQRPLDTTLADFGAMLGAYVTAATGERPIRIEIDFIGNESGIDKELPTDLGQYARNVIEKIGAPFETYRTLPAFFNMPHPAGTSLALVQGDRPRPPEPSYRLVGSLLRASERAVVGRDKRADALFGNGHTQSDVEVTGDNTRTITAVTLALTLESPNGIAVRGATAEYRINVERSELNRSISIYVAGSGIGGGKKLTLTQDSADALYDASAMCIVHLLGNALLLPYYRSSPMFGVDEALVGRVQDAFNRLTRAELEQNVKRYLFVDGYAMDVHGPDLTDADRAVVALEMHRRSLDFSDRAALAEFAMQLWKNLDYTEAARRVTGRMAQSAQVQRERIEQAARAEAESIISPAEFGWPPSARIVILDLSHINNVELQRNILAIVRTCDGCEEIRTHPTKACAGVRISSQPAEIQRILRRGSLPLEYVWASAGQQRRLVLVPATAALAATGSAEKR
jgi:hypothetical protein